MNQDKLDQFNELVTSRIDTVNANLNDMGHEVDEIKLYEVCGKLVSAIGTSVEAYLPGSRIGDLCRIEDHVTHDGIFAEVLSLNNDKVRLLPFGSISDIAQDVVIKNVGDKFQIKVGDFLLGKIVNGFGEVTESIVKSANPQSIDATNYQLSPIYCAAPDPYNRPIINDIMETGVKVIDLFNTCGKGQRIGIFAGPGMGKTTLMGMIIRNSKVDVVVVCLVGERGREVREFIDLEIGEEVASKCVLVVATSDKSSVEQLKCAYVAQTIAEYFRESGKDVLLFMDSVTRFARAGREVGLSAGEGVARGGYPASVFLSFPKLMERAGNSPKGTITAFYTVLMEGENISEDVIADEIKSILDGHIVLSRKLVERGQFPAVDVLKSLSRVADRIITENQLNAARRIRLLISQYDELEFLLKVGEYKPGMDPLSDEAVSKMTDIQNLLKQKTLDQVKLELALNKLFELAGI